MNRINVFYEHIEEACAQRGGTAEDMLAKAKSMGIDGLEFDLWRLNERDRVKDMLERCGMKTSSVYNMYDFVNEDGNLCEKKYRSHLETAAFFGADRVLCIPGFIGEGDSRERALYRITEQLNRMCAAAREYGITVTVEDYDDMRSPCSTAEGLEYLVKNVDGLKITFDTGNFIYSLESAEEAYRRLGGSVAHVHLKDRSWSDISENGDKSGSKACIDGRLMFPCPVGSGFIGVEKLIFKLLDGGYGGSFSIEHFGAPDQLGFMERSAEVVNNVIQRFTTNGRN
ncbi:MAG: sugar phosphate isomerase/epimerase [Ruminococcus sp.]|nr:sugar phosphate isomerase/epimerase [Ruminococcus sp.]